MAEMLLTSQVAREAGMSGEGIRAAERRGAIRATRAGRVRLFERSEVDRFLREHCAQKGRGR